MIALALLLLAQDDWSAGTATAVITPDVPLPMAGYASRKEPAEGKEQELYAKALAIRDREGARVVVLTMDLIGVHEDLRAAVVEHAKARHGLPPETLLLNASHTHCGPQYAVEESRAYRESLVKTLKDLVDRALEGMSPAALAWSRARCGFAMNRRTPTASGYRNHPNPDGPVDHEVPVLSVAGPDGKLRAALFGYACHNTTMGFRRWLGDYAGYAQGYLEADHPGVTALFLTGCGGDQNPYPRSELKYAQMHGRSLATSVEAALEVNQKTPLHRRPLKGPLRAVLETVELEYTTPGRAPHAYPVQILQFGKDLALVALGSEVVVDYALRLKRELAGGPALWIAGYSNSYAGYIPSKRVLQEGGYEAQSRPWKDTIEERVVGKVRELYLRLNP